MTPEERREFSEKFQNGFAYFATRNASAFLDAACGFDNIPDVQQTVSLKKTLGLLCYYVVAHGIFWFWWGLVGSLIIGNPLVGFGMALAVFSWGALKVVMNRRVPEGTLYEALLAGFWPIVPVALIAVISVSIVGGVWANRIFAAGFVLAFFGSILGLMRGFGLRAQFRAGRTTHFALFVRVVVHTMNVLWLGVCLWAFFLVFMFFAGEDPMESLGAGAATAIATLIPFGMLVGREEDAIRVTPWQAVAAIAATSGLLTLPMLWVPVLLEATNDDASYIAWIVVGCEFMIGLQMGASNATIGIDRVIRGIEFSVKPSVAIVCLVIAFASFVLGVFILSSVERLLSISIPQGLSSIVVVSIMIGSTALGVWLYRSWDRRLHMPERIHQWLAKRCGRDTEEDAADREKAMLSGVFETALLEPIRSGSKFYVEMANAAKVVLKERLAA